MRITRDKIRLFLITALLATMLLQSCNKTQRSGIDPEIVIPEEDMVEVLTELYLAEGLLNYPPVRGEYMDKDSMENYSDAISKYGYTKMRVDSSMKFYFIDRPDTYEDIYNRVIENLSGMEADVIQEISNKPDVASELWEGDRTYRLPDYGVASPVEFSVRTRGLGTYIFKARITLYRDDESINPRTELWYWYEDEEGEEHKIPWEVTKLEKTGRPRIVTLKDTLDNPRVTHIRGKVLNHDPKKGHWEKHAIVTNIRLNREPSEEDIPFNK